LRPRDATPPRRARPQAPAVLRRRRRACASCAARLPAICAVAGPAHCCRCPRTVVCHVQSPAMRKPPRPCLFTQAGPLCSVHPAPYAESRSSFGPFHTRQSQKRVAPYLPLPLNTHTTCALTSCWLPAPWADTCDRGVPRGACAGATVARGLPAPPAEERRSSARGGGTKRAKPSGSGNKSQEPEKQTKLSAAFIRAPRRCARPAARGPRRPHQTLWSAGGRQSRRGGQPALPAPQPPPPPTAARVSPCSLAR
jgi:hypothetical protein